MKTKCVCETQMPPKMANSKYGQGQGQGQGHNVKNTSAHGMVYSRRIFMWNIKALALTVQKLLTRFKFSKRSSKVMVTR